MGYTSPFKTPFPQLPAITGVKLAAAATGMKYRGRNDLMLVTLAEGTTVAGVFTKNSMCGVPIDWCRSILPSGSARALIVNAGSANVFTGKDGERVLKNTTIAVAKILGCSQKEVYVASTGVIGVLPDEDKIIKNIPALYDSLSDAAWEQAASAIMTTDTFAKGISKRASIGGVVVTLNGIIKGSGMIAPDMATMLGYVFTDAKIPASVLQELLDEDVKHSYNCMTVDSDTSTSDMVLVFATGQAEHAKITNASSKELADFRAKLRELHIEMAKFVAKDGEGITKFITVKVTGAKTDEAARIIAKSIANSPLVKCAVTGADPNWGRIAMAIGKSGEEANRDKTSIWIGDSLIARNGVLHQDYKEEEAAKYMKNSEITLAADVGIAKGKAEVWTMDLTHDYIRINVNYRS